MNTMQYVHKYLLNTSDSFQPARMHIETIEGDIVLFKVSHSQ